MSNDFIRNIIKNDLSLDAISVSKTIDLLEEGATIPFIARYRKEKTGSLDETNIRSIAEKLAYYKELNQRKETILKSINQQEKLTPELQKQIQNCTDKNKLEDLYLPFKPRKASRATLAKEKGLEPLADLIYQQGSLPGSKVTTVGLYLNPAQEINTYEEALQGALDIIAERVATNEFIRGWVRNQILAKGFICSKVKKDWREKKSKFEGYYEFSELIRKAPSHRLLAIRRGAAENILSWKIEIEESGFLGFIESRIISNRGFLFVAELKIAIKDSFKRLIYPTIEKEVFNLRLEVAEEEAIKVFSRNLRNLLLQPPAGSRLILGVDPGFRSGCKLALIDQRGGFQINEVIYPHESHHKKAAAENILLGLIKEHRVELVAIGNGTASKETDRFVREVISKHKLTAKAVVVSEAGASVYSASPAAIEEFPQLDVTVRGAISIARRLHDPLAELVKIDPKAIGVGQYQHDVNQKALKESLDLTVESCVNHVGVDLNTASVELLSYVSGIGKKVALNIVQYRSEHGSFQARTELKKVPKLGGKTFEQCAGFLRIRNSSNRLDNSAIHPESYAVVIRMSRDLGEKLEQIIGNENMISGIELDKYISEDCGLPTLNDILAELRKPGLDPRQEFSSIEFSSELNDISDLKQDMVLMGAVTNVTNFGAFVDIGVHQDGLIHISQLSSGFVKSPYDIIAVGDSVKVKVLEVDESLKRISLQRLEEINL